MGRDGVAGVALQERQLILLRPEDGLELLECIHREELPHRHHGALSHRFDHVRVGRKVFLGRQQVGSQEILEVLGGDPAALEIAVVEADRALDQVAEPSPDLFAPLGRVALGPHHADLGSGLAQCRPGSVSRIDCASTIPPRFRREDRPISPFGVASASSKGLHSSSEGSAAIVSRSEAWSKLRGLEPGRTNRTQEAGSNGPTSSVEGSEGPAHVGGGGVPTPSLRRAGPAPVPPGGADAG